jgi:hypothetical protein
METPAALSARINQNPRVCSRKDMCVGQCRNLLNQETKKLVNFMLDVRRFVTEAGKLTTEGEILATGGQLKAKKKQVVETTCGSHEKTSRDSLTKPGKLPLKNVSPGNNNLKVITN